MTQQYYQNDPQWKNNLLGFHPTATIGTYGCLLTCMTMVANHFGGNYTPVTYNEVMKQNGGFNPGQQWIKTFTISKILPAVKYQKGVECPDSPAPLADIDTGLANGSLVVINVDRDSDDTVFEAMDGHWVVVHKKEGDNYLIWDPSKQDGAANTLTGRYGFGFKKAEEIIKQVIWFGTGDWQTPAPTKTAPVAPSTKAAPVIASPPSASPRPMPTIPPKTTTVKVTATQISLRSKPQVASDNLIEYINQNAILEIIETGNPAQKIGVQNQWLQVRAPSGKTGYVAAWHVAISDSPPAGTPPPTITSPAPAPPTTPLTVKVTATQISLRSQPQVASDNLIEYINQNAILEIIETGNPAQKIGVQNQWLQVRAPSGKTGYVAAWYVAKN